MKNDTTLRRRQPNRIDDAANAAREFVERLNDLKENEVQEINKRFNGDHERTVQDLKRDINGFVASVT